MIKLRTWSEATELKLLQSQGKGGSTWDMLKSKFDSDTISKAVELNIYYVLSVLQFFDIIKSLGTFKDTEFVGKCVGDLFEYLLTLLEQVTVERAENFQEVYCTDFYKKQVSQLLGKTVQELRTDPFMGIVWKKKFFQGF